MVCHSDSQFSTWSQTDRQNYHWNLSAVMFCHSDSQLSTFWNFLELSRTFWNLLEPSGTLNLLKPSRNFWNLSAVMFCHSDSQFSTWPQTDGQTDKLSLWQTLHYIVSLVWVTNSKGSSRAASSQQKRKWEVLFFLSLPSNKEPIKQ